MGTTDRLSLTLDTNLVQHILSKKHRKFAENNENWSQLDALLSQLERLPKYSDDVDDSDY